MAAQSREWMRAAELQWGIEPVGNVLGHYASAADSARALVVGSHYDMLLNAGAFRLASSPPVVVAAICG
ncbi:MAG TPA: hypothetical protein VGJ20_39225 [Xanthobacteraceae bacterium]